MGRIHLLDDDVINKIAAGEVVERPASVAKELIENALDAGATNIELALELGGVRSIAVTDNGLGMSAADAHMALKRHATSKIRQAEDLVHIASMGFRGEALASIAAVSRFSLATIERGGNAEGIKLTVTGGEAPVSWPWNGPPGTTVVVENLFYNLPARGKFLKAPATELSHCLDLVQAFALCHPEVSFTLRHNGRETFRAPALPGPTRATPAAGAMPGELGAEALRSRAQAILGKDAADLLYVRAGNRHGQIEALVSPPGVEKATSKGIFTFVNGRWVKDKVLRYGVLRGYHSHLLKGRFPLAIVHLRLDPALVDVNVHPAKTEVRFQYPDEVQGLIALGIRDQLRQGAWAGVSPQAPAVLPQRGAERSDDRSDDRSPPPPAGQASVASRGASRTEARMSPPMDLTFSRSERRSTSPVVTGEAPWGAVHDKSGLDSLLASYGAPVAAGGEANAAWPDLAFDQGPTTSVTAGPVIPWDELRYLGAFANCFLFFAAGRDLLVADQHALHERVLYERLVGDAELLGRSQPLLVPEAIELRPSQIASLLARQAELAARGFAYAAEGETTIVVKAVPALLAGRDINALMEELSADFDGEPGDEPGPAAKSSELAHHILAKIACHGAVRAGEELPPAELNHILAAARSVDFYHNCPHGRRVFRWWTREQVARWFDR